MIDGVADEVAERIAHRLDDVAIELDVGALHVEIDFLAQPVGEVAHRAREPLGQRGEGGEARIHHAPVEVARGAAQAVDFRLERAADVLRKPLGRLAETRDAVEHLGGLIREADRAPARERARWAPGAAPPPR